MPTAKKPTRTAGGQLGVVVNNVVSLRATADADSERVTQALIGEPRLLLLDEPLINLDPRHQHEIVTLVRDVQRERGLTVIFTTHEINPLLGVLDRVLYLGGGAAALGTVEAVITGPVLSRLYNAPIEVVRLGGRIFVFSGAADLEANAHRHDDSGHSHDA